MYEFIDNENGKICPEGTIYGSCDLKINDGAIISKIKAELSEEHNESIVDEYFHDEEKILHDGPNSKDYVKEEKVDIEDFTIQKETFKIQ
ncbi:hypothetical protein HHI36_021714 [Cryptolaemus montrouzieri]|uniref:Uncharacterized protein n=1 Tax=Cryptolaemus montrouzieri TaxID=559131 RepID=A0ABD2MXK2_9CUCU